ncbi:hypothetical protein AYR62_15270 [Secundilactobacillus paracollinoides]|uniref:ATP-cone domain-containing protein n=1 Tax=Secundilactobacillus paracollinoides TaxID=240427 RepID=A0A1B2IW32_9LACO|nr:ATP cone domain-containing protein [Secundilactobacillus paracollinoides]ANZ60414.1 hypothetical protein AYR61_03000 [Secundilactobacillus paracollinoides]ANZ65303.1 hypothetical protein AYR62_15270 [Secundilactobacillus paracollinoides]ANZ66242.1 hypothetical protein AYR63_03205 [Secundilactobacillus paracollinoides]KRL76700.1 hypothetical protein FC17_GL001766 [Secundilactobacillus paracollinoides DSM 15502 = JCM 11969]
MNKQKPQQSHIQITVRFVEKRNGKKDVFDARKILSSLNHLTHDDRLIRRTNALVLAQIAGYSQIDTQTIRQLITSTLTQLDHPELAKRYSEYHPSNPKNASFKQLSFFNL